MLPPVFITLIAVGIVSAAITVYAGGLMLLRLRCRNQSTRQWFMPVRTDNTDMKMRIARFMVDLRDMDR